ncbi:MAG TPA: RtcB family protein [Gaiellaceae bacterium]
MASVKTFGEVDERSLRQLRTCMEAGDAEFGVLCADHHPGYSQPIGGGIAYEGYVSPSGVGYDIGCIGSGARVTTAEGYALTVEDVAPESPIVCLDDGSLRLVAPNLGAVARGVRATIEIQLVNGRRLRVTRDHRVRTRRGWVEAGHLWEDDELLLTPFVGLPYRPFDLHPALVRVLAYVSGDGHLTRDGKRVSIYSTNPDDAAALAGDLRRLGYRPLVYRRTRAQHRAPEIHVAVNSTELHERLSALGSAVGRKRWPQSPAPWLFDAPAWVRALFLSAFASAEMVTPRIVAGGIANLALKQADRNAAHFVGELFESLGFRYSIAASGTAWVLHVVGGEAEKLRFFEEVGFCRAAAKRRAAAACASVAWQRLALISRREEARDLTLQLRAAGATHKVAVAEAAVMHGLTSAVVHHAVYRKGPWRRGRDVALIPDAWGEAAWLGIRDVVAVGSEGVWDVATADPAESFLAEGCVVHNCGNKAVRTNLAAADVDVAGVMREIERRISFGMGVPNREQVDHPVLDKIVRADFAPQRKLHQVARSQLGTVGSGNHFVNLFADVEGRVWVGVHFGSRGFGHKTASGFLALAQGLAFDEHARGGEMDSPPVLFPVESELGQAYVAAMELAGEYAYAGRDVVVAKVLEILGAEAVHEVHNHHNFAWREEHFGRTYWVIRKGCTPARPGQEGFVGSSMGDDSVILEGVAGAEAEESLFSTVHGAGRVMSRSQAAGRVRRATVFACTVRDCAFFVPAKEYSSQTCPEHGTKLRRSRREIVMRPGRVDWPAVQERLRSSGIVLIGGGADEAPEVYKRLPDVLAAHGSSIRVKHTLRPLGVAMAGRDVFDPYKD